LGVNRSGAGVAVSHRGSLQDIKSILPLVKKDPGRMRLNSDPEEVVKHTQILHSKLLLKRGDNAAEE
jgi:hypothetical protein